VIYVVSYLQALIQIRANVQHVFN